MRFTAFVKIAYSEGDPMYDEQWDAICGSMARIMETVGIKHEELDYL